MAEIVNAGPRKPPRPITLEQWMKIMARIFNVIDAQLGKLEHKADAEKRKGRQSGLGLFEPQDVRALGALANAVAKVRIINESIKDEQASEDARRELKEGRARQEELERRLARLAQSEEEA